MSSSKENRREEQVADLFLKALQEKADNNESRLLDEIWAIIETSDRLRKLISRFDLLTSFHSFKSGKPEKDFTKAKVAEHLKKTLFTSSEHDFYFPIHLLKKYPDGYKLGYCTARHFDMLPKMVQDELIRTWQEVFTLEKGFAKDSDQFVKWRKESLHLHVRIQANGFFKADELAEQRIQATLDILRMQHYEDFQVKEYCHYVEAASQCYTGGFTPAYLLSTAASVYDKKSDVWIKEMNSLLAKGEAATEIERKLTNGHHIIAVATSVRYVQVKFVILCFALEAMVLTESDKDYLGWKLAERIALLTAQPADRMERYKKVKRMYGMRSSFVHQSDIKKEITEENVTELRDLVIDVFLQVLNLKNRGFQYVSERNPRDPKVSVVDYLDNIKFSTSSKV